MLFGLLFGNLQAQSDFDFTQRWFNESLYNPAAAGNSFSTGLFLHSRTQWLGLDRAPVTVAGSFDFYSQPLRSGFALNVVADYLGPRHNYHFRGAYAYMIDLGETGILSMGLSAGLYMRGWYIKPTDLDNPSDPPALIYNERKEYTPDFDFGLEYLGPFKLGISLRHIGAKHLSKDLYPPDLHLWSYASSRFNLGESVSFEPLVAFTWRANISRFEGGFLMYFFKVENLRDYNDRFWVGAVYRTDHNIALMAGLNLTSQLRIGYSFDYGAGSVARLANVGSHEVFLAWQINRKFYKEFCCPVAYQ